MNNIAGKLYRVLSGLIDVFLWSLGLMFVILQVSQSENVESFLTNLLWALTVVITYGVFLSLFNSATTTIFGGTLGKILTGTKTVNIDGQTLSFSKAIFRNSVGHLLSGCLLGLGHVWILIDKENRAWHDMMAGTYVILVSKYRYIIGLVIIIGILYLNFLLATNIITNFNNNSFIYTELWEMLFAS